MLRRSLTLALLAGSLAAVPTASAAPVAAPDGLRARPAAGDTALRAASAGTPDPRDPEAWHLATDAPLGLWGAWSRTTGGDVPIAILDTGADLGHPDLAGNLWTNPGEIAGNGLDDDHDGTVDDVHGVDLVNRDGVPADDNGHGTHVAGIAGAVGGNGIGASGVAWRVRLMIVKVLDGQAGGDTGTVAEGIRWAVAHGARVVNLSLSGPGRSADLEDAVAAAQAAGVLVVAAAGNDGHDLGLLPSYPASYPGAALLGVAATEPEGILTAVSSFGAGADLAAPGATVLATARGGGYEYRTGTSMAAPMVGGAAALLLAAEPGLDGTAVAARLVRTARRTGLPVGAGALDVGAALGVPAGSATAPPAGTTGAGTGTGIAATTPSAAPADDPPDAAAAAARADRARAARDLRAARTAAAAALRSARARASAD